MFNPYQPYMQQAQQIIRVNGTEGAKAYNMSANSSALLLDESAPRIFLKTTDGAGYPTISAYKLEKYEDETIPDIKELSNRITKIERMLKDAKPNNSNVKRKELE